MLYCSDSMYDYIPLHRIRVVIYFTKLHNVRLNTDQNDFLLGGAYENEA